jgi:hypothetical protein
MQVRQTLEILQISSLYMVAVQNKAVQLLQVTDLVKVLSAPTHQPGKNEGVDIVGAKPGKILWVVGQKLSRL